MNNGALIKRRILVMIAILLSVLVMSIVVYLVPFFPAKNAQQGAVLKLELNQDSSGVSVAQMELKEGYPADYKIRYRDNFLTIKLVSEDNETLFSGAFLTKTVSIHESFENGKQTASLSEIFFPKITLYLPYYRIAKTILISDESQREVLRKEIDHSSFETTSGFKRQCGNGICDQNENLISCFKDCMHY